MLRLRLTGGRAVPAYRSVLNGIDPKHEQVFAYTRMLGDEGYLVMLNFGAAPLDYGLPGLALFIVCISR